MGIASAQLDQQLDELLSEGIEAARKREATAFDQRAGAYAGDVVLFGAGNLGRSTLAGLRKVGIEPLSFIDSNKTRWSESVDGLRVCSPEEGAGIYGARAAAIVTIWRGEGAARMSTRVAQLRQLGYECVVPFLPLSWKFADSLLPNYLHDLPHRVLLQADRVRDAYRLMDDDTSRSEYLSQLRYRLLGDFGGLPDPVDGPMYFRDELFRLGEDETLLDCGAYDGDTLSLFLNKTGDSFERAIAFEPDPLNYRKLAERVSGMPVEIRERITLYQAATGETNERVLMDVGSGVASQVGKGDHEVESFALDSILDETPVSIIKMDIEGAEIATLSGARKLIRKNLPVLTISAYHRQGDLWNIPLLIHDLSPDYSFYLKPHMLEGWDLVCYAVPSNRKI